MVLSQTPETVFRGTLYTIWAIIMHAGRGVTLHDTSDSSSTCSDVRRPNAAVICALWQQNSSWEVHKASTLLDSCIIVQAAQVHWLGPHNSILQC